MNTFNLKPRFRDTDALGHINNASVPTWFEEARRCIFEIFIPDLDPKKWNLILARVELDFVAQAFYQKDVVIKTGIERIGNSSFTIVQSAYQDDELVAKSKSFMVHFNYASQKSEAIPADKRELLEKLLVKQE